MKRCVMCLKKILNPPVDVSKETNLICEDCYEKLLTNMGVVCSFCDAGYFVPLEKSEKFFQSMEEKGVFLKAETTLENMIIIFIAECPHCRAIIHNA